MNKFILGIAIAILLNGCGESAEDKAKSEYKEKVFAIKIVKNDVDEQIEAITKEYEKKYGLKANIWFEEIKGTNEWKAMKQKAYDSVKGKHIDYSNFDFSVGTKKGEK